MEEYSNEKQYYSETTINECTVHEIIIGHMVNMTGYAKYKNKRFMKCGLTRGLNTEEMSPAWVRMKLDTFTFESYRAKKKSS